MSSIILLLGAGFLAKVCRGQSITPAPTASCNYCFLAPGYTDVSSSHEEYLLFTAYSMTSAFSQDEFCITNSGASTSLQTPYSLAKPATATADPAQYQSAVATWFISYLSVRDWGICGENGSLAVHMANENATAFVEVAVPTVLGVASPMSFMSSSETTTLEVTQSSLRKPASVGLSPGVIGLVVSVVVLGLILPALILWYKYRKQHAAMMERKIEEKLETETETETGFSRGV